MGTGLLTDFLLARIAEDEEGAREVGSWVWGNSPRVLAECQAKRQMVRLHVSSFDTRGVGHDVDGKWTAYCEFDIEPWPCAHAKALAHPYADHPDFSEEWRA